MSTDPTAERERANRLAAALANIAELAHDVNNLNLTPSTRAERALAIQADALRALREDRAAIAPCCDMHNRHCEPPADLCCHTCPEAGHPQRHDHSECVLAAAAKVHKLKSVELRRLPMSCLRFRLRTPHGAHAELEFGELYECPGIPPQAAASAGETKTSNEEDRDA